MKSRTLAALSLAAVLGTMGVLGAGRIQPAEPAPDSRVDDVTPGLVELKAELDEFQAELDYWSDESERQNNMMRIIAKWAAEAGPDSHDRRSLDAEFDAAFRLSLRAEEHRQDAGAEMARRQAEFHQRQAEHVRNKPMGPGTP